MLAARNVFVGDDLNLVSRVDENLGVSVVLYVRHAVGMQNDVAGSCQFTRKRRHSTASANTCDAPRYRRQAASLAMFIAAMRRTSSQIQTVLSSFPSPFRLQRWTELIHSSAGRRRARGVLPCMGRCAP